MTKEQKDLRRQMYEAEADAFEALLLADCDRRMIDPDIRLFMIKEQYSLRFKALQLTEE